MSDEGEKMKKTETLVIRLDATLQRQIDEFAERMGEMARSTAARYLIRQALKEKAQ